VAAGLALSWLFAGAASGQEDGEDEGTTDDPLELTRAAVPETLPEQLHLRAAERRFGDLVREFDDTTPVDIDDGSVLTGLCGGIVMTYGEDGGLVDAALDAGTGDPPVDVLDGGQAFTADNPFEVDTRGVVAYFGFMPRRGEGPEDHRWQISTAGVRLDHGGDENRRGVNRNAGVVDLGAELPFAFSADAEVDGSLVSANLEECGGQGYVRFTAGNPLTTVPGIVGTATLLAGVLGLLFTARPTLTHPG
jgi:hypothetical protein